MNATATPTLVEAFADAVLEAARQAPETESTPQSRGARFGGYKVFLCHLWATLHREHYIPRPQFDALLLQANREGLLVLSRADLVQVMNAADVRESEVAYLTATFHFVRV